MKAQNEPNRRTLGRRGKAITIEVIVEIINADGTPEEIAAKVGRPVSTVKLHRKYDHVDGLAVGTMGDTIRMMFMMEKAIEAGLSASRKDFRQHLPSDRALAKLIGSHHWSKSKHVIARVRAEDHAHKAELKRLKGQIADRKQKIAEAEFLNRCAENGQSAVKDWLN